MQRPVTPHRTILSLCVGLVMTQAGHAAEEQPTPQAQAVMNPILLQSDAERLNPDVSPARRIERRDNPDQQDGRRPRPQPGPPGQSLFRQIDGSGNNRQQPQMGAADTPLARLVSVDYGDGESTLAGMDRPGPRMISNIVFAQSESTLNRRRTTDFLWQWGQFLDHDIDLTDGVDPAELEPIAVPAGDPWFDPAGQGDITIAFNRSIHAHDEQGNALNPRMQLNEITGWIDASNVYGSDEERAHALRTLDGSGQLKTSEGDLLPFNVDGLENAGGSGDQLFLAGDVRANEQLGLTAMHTLFMREHNRLARQIAAQQPDLDGEEIYQRARHITAALMQKITYRDYLPALLGNNALAPYRGYRPEVDGSIANVFSTAAYRYGHSALSPFILRIGADGQESEFGHLALRDAFFSPMRLRDEGGIEPMLRGLAAQQHQAIDSMTIDDIRNFLFGPPGAGGFDLISLNIQRGRDHGLPSYNDTREQLGLDRIPGERFDLISSDPDTQQRLETAYGDVDRIDVWVGGLAEDHVRGAQVGELMRAIMVRQFQALRDGDRFWYEGNLSRSDREQINRTTLADIIRRNTEIGDEIQDDVFRIRRARP